MCNCATCKHSLFDVLWGEYKCEVRETILYILLTKEDCPSYEPKTDNELRIAKRNSERMEDES